MLSLSIVTRGGQESSAEWLPIALQRTGSDPGRRRRGRADRGSMLPLPVFHMICLCGNGYDRAAGPAADTAPAGPHGRPQGSLRLRFRRRGHARHKLCSRGTLIITLCKDCNNGISDKFFPKFFSSPLPKPETGLIYVDAGNDASACSALGRFSGRCVPAGARGRMWPRDLPAYRLITYSKFFGRICGYEFQAPQRPCARETP